MAEGVGISEGRASKIWQSYNIKEGSKTICLGKSDRRTREKRTLIYGTENTYATRAN